MGFWAKLVVLLIVALMLYFVSFAVCALFAKIGFGTSLGQLGDLMKTNCAFIKISQTIISVATFGVSALFCGYLFYKNNDAISTKNKPKIISIILAIILTYTIMMIVSFLAFENQKINFGAFQELFMQMENKAKDATILILTANNSFEVFVNIIVIALVPAICEELFFRSQIQRYLMDTKMNAFWAILISASIFSAFHFQFFGFIPRLFLGLVLGYLYYLKRSIWLSSTLHFFNNATAVIAFMHQGKAALEDNNLVFDSKMYIALVFSIVFSLIILWALYKIEKK